MKWFFSLLAILLFTTLLIACDWSQNGDVTGQQVVRTALVEPSAKLGLISAPEGSRYDSPAVAEIEDCVKTNPGKRFFFRRYITPEEPSIKALAAQINGVRDAYQIAVQWAYVSEQRLNNVSDKWLTSHEFLVNTPHYLSNPLQGEEVSDCEEQSHSLASLLRAQGVPPEEVRVALGEVELDGVKMGHAWIELLTDGHWLALDPSSGPYWDDKAGQLIRRRGVPFDYYASHAYPMIQVWTYYNDIYYSDRRDGLSNAPASWCKAATIK